MNRHKPSTLRLLAAHILDAHVVLYVVASIAAIFMVLDTLNRL